MATTPQDFIILLDALRHDYIDESITPFLFSQKQSGEHAKVIESYSFQTRPAYFAGLEPDESNICHLFQFNPDLSPFRFLKPFSPLLDSFDRSRLAKYARGSVRRFAKRACLKMGQPAAADVISTEQVPLSLLPFFALSERVYTDDEYAFGERKSIFDLFREHNRTWNWIGYPRHFGSTKSILSAYQKAPTADVSYLHFSELDWIGHKFGPESDEIHHALAEIDQMLSELLLPSLERGKRVVIFGDHGMVEVKYRIDVWTILNTLQVRAPRDYVFFLDSTGARFWYFSKRAKEEIEAALAELQGGHFLSAEERATLHLNFGNNWYGDAIFAIDGPGIIHPSFFARQGLGPKGMHGYMPHEKDNMTQVLAFGEGIRSSDRGTIGLTEIFEILSRQLLPQSRAPSN